MVDITGARRNELRCLAERWGVQFTNIALLDRALTHASALGEDAASADHYESLEFLGDAALGLAVAGFLFSEMPGQSPGEYSRMRAGVVNKDALARVAVELGLPGAIRLGRGEERAGGRNRKGLLADCLEAVFGAMYVDQDWEKTRSFIVSALRSELDQAGSNQTSWDPKSRLQQLCQANQWPLPVFALLRAEGPDHRKEFEVEVRVRGESLGQGRGSTIKEAEQHAAESALQRDPIKRQPSQLD